MTRGSDEPDIQIGAAARAKRLRFNKAPKTDVEFEKEGDIRLEDARLEIETSSGSQRENLPEEVEPGVTYRDVQIGWGASAKLRTHESENDKRDG
jgi:hypothetical protein